MIAIVLYFHSFSRFASSDIANLFFFSQSQGADNVLTCHYWHSQIASAGTVYLKHYEVCIQLLQHVLCYTIQMLYRHSFVPHVYQFYLWKIDIVSLFKLKFTNFQSSSVWRCEFPNAATNCVKHVYVLYVVQGERGIPGVQGQQGSPGKLGPEGPQGRQGFKGSYGDSGAFGPKGFRVNWFSCLLAL